MIEKKIIVAQEAIKKTGWAGWLLYDFRKTNDLACSFLQISKDALLTRRFFYWIPKTGKPVKVVHRIESHVLDHLPGKVVVYSSYEELESQLKAVLKGCSKIAMEYSPLNAIPTVSKVDGGTIDLIRSFGVSVESSADLLQPFTSVWTLEQFKSHLAAANVLQAAVESAWRLIAKAVKNHEKIGEVDIQKFIRDVFERNGCVADDPPICAVNANSASPHYSPTSQVSKQIKAGDFVLIDVWCKKNTPHAVYADITRVGVVGTAPQKKQQEIFGIVKAGRDASIELLRKRFQADEPVMGWEVDQACRDVIDTAGYGEYFTHRTGHNIGERDHGDGANIDNFETKDFRRLLPGTCFSIEPGIYLPGEFGVRLEDDVYLDLNGKDLHLTKGMQKEIKLIDVDAS